MSGGALVLVPWHIGNRLDVTLRAARAARELRVLYAEEPGYSREQFERLFGVDCRGKVFRAIPGAPDAAVLEEIMSCLALESVGLVSSGGTPCFIDPGSWIVAAVRERGGRITPLAGASILATMLELSGVDWTGAHPRGSFVLFHAPEDRCFQEAVRRAREPVFVFLAAARFSECLKAMREGVGSRPVSVFFDLTKGAVGKYPWADRIETRTCEGWLAEAGKIPWTEISDIALMIHPEGMP